MGIVGDACTLVLAVSGFWDVWQRSMLFFLLFSAEFARCIWREASEASGSTRIRKWLLCSAVCASHFGWMMLTADRGQ